MPAIPSKADVIISGLTNSAESCKLALERSGLSVVIIDPHELKAMHAPTYVIGAGVAIDDEDAHVVVIEKDTEELGIEAAHEVLAELFDDSEPGDEI